ncbi:MAG: transporter substrate-binding domain-containing protein [Bradyrhizobiaceae bacterium]|nr:transporter substrate-binding domain-containing protein [Bradyrhizobiaceae bacterium]
MMSALKTCAAAVLVLVSAAPAWPRSLQAITDRGALTLCANPDALPWASKTGDLPGFQVELAENLAMRLGVSLNRQWVLSAIQYRRADCDVVFDAISRKDADVEGGLRLSRPYQRSGIVLAVRDSSAARSLDDLSSGQRVGVLTGSLASMTLGKRGVAISPFVLEGDLIAALGGGEIDAAAITPTAIGWYNKAHPQARIRAIQAFADNPDFNWNLAVGMIGPDDPLRQRVDAALGDMLADGTVARIYGRYGVEVRPPQ